MGRPINTKLPDLAAHYSQLTAAEGVDGEGNKWNCIDIEFNVSACVHTLSLLCVAVPARPPPASTRA